MTKGLLEKQYNIILFFQVIIGPAGTGKTILIQLKIVDILDTYTDSKVMVFLPYDRLVQSYKDFFLSYFKNNRTEDSFEHRMFIGKITDAWQYFYDQNKPHVFIDEFSAIKTGGKTKAKELQERLLQNPQSIMWVTLDFRQNLELAGFGSPG